MGARAKLRRDNSVSLADFRSVYRGVYHRPHPSPKPPLLSSAMCASSHAPRRFLYPTGEEVLFNRRPSFENE